MKKTLLLLALFVGMQSVFAQKKHKIELQIKNLHDTTVLLGYHYGSKKLVADTIRVDKNGRGFFEGDSLLDGGLYLVLTPSLRYFEMIIDDNQQVFKMTSDTTDLFGNLQFQASNSNSVFLAYQQKSSALYKTRKPIVDKLRAYYEVKDTSKLSSKQLQIRRDSIAFLQNQMEELRKEMISYEDGIIAQYPKSLLTSILTCTRELDVPDYPRNEKGVITDSLFKYTYMKKHYFDKVNLADARLLKTPVYEMKLDHFFDNELLQIPDSITPEVNKLLTKILDQEKQGYEGKMYYYTLHHLFMKYQNPKFMGLDNVFVDIMGEYYMKNKLPKRVIADTAYMAKIKKRYSEMVYNKVGGRSPELLVYSSKNQWMYINQIKAEYTVLYFYDVDCGHCKKTIPEWQHKFDSLGLAKYGVANVLFYTQTDTADWAKFIKEKKLDNAMHVFDPMQNTDFRTLFDVYSTPVSYILDKNKKIIAKRLPPETMIEVLQKELEKKGKKVVAVPSSTEKTPPPTDDKTKKTKK